MATEEERKRLAHELVELAKQRPSEFYRRGNGNDERYSVLTRIVKTIRGEQAWEDSPYLALDSVLSEAISRLPTSMSGRLPEDLFKPRPPGRERRNSWECSPEREMAYILYGYREEAVPQKIHVDGSKSPKTYNDDYLPAALQLAHGEADGKETRKRTVEVIRQDLADILLEMERQAQLARVPVDATNATVDVLVPPEAQTPFIPRPRLTAFFNEVAYDTDLLLCVFGEPCTGKTRFVREQTAADNPVWIDARSDETLLRGMEDLLKRYGFDTALFDRVRIRQAFGDLLTREDAPKLVVIDGIPDPKVLDLVIPLSITNRVIVTSCLRPPEDWWRVNVDDMELEEAADMAAALLPESSDSDHLSLAALFGCRPLLIEHSCHYLRNNGITDIPSYCDTVQRDLAAAIEAAADKADWVGLTLNVIYKQYVDQLERKSPRSIALLEMLCYVAHVNVPPEYAMAYLLGVPIITPDLLVSAQVKYDAAVGPLVAYSLVSVTPGYGLSMQPLTQHVLRGIFRGRLPAIMQQALPLQHVDYSGLLAAGWSVFTLAGHATCNGVLLLHLKELLWPHLSVEVKEEWWPGDTHRSYDGVIGSPQWTFLVTEMWQRMCDWATYCWFMDQVLGWRDDATESRHVTQPEFDLASYLEPTQYAIQNDERAALRDVITQLHLRTFLGDAYEAFQRDPNATKAVLTFDLRSIATRIVRGHQDSPLGQLDISMFFAGAADRLEEALQSASFSGEVEVTRRKSPRKEHLATMSEAELEQRMAEHTQPGAIEANGAEHPE